MEHSHQGRPVPDPSVVDHGEEIAHGDPSHLVSLRDVGRLSDPFGTDGGEHLVRRVSDSDRRLELEHPTQLLWAPPGFFLDLSRRSVRGLLTRLNNAHRDFPAPRIVHEPVAAQHEQRLLLLVEHDGYCNSLQSKHMMLKTMPARGLDVYEAYVDPAAGVDRPLAMGSPFRWAPVMLFGRHVPNVPRSVLVRSCAQVVHGCRQPRHHSTASPNQHKKWTVTA